jgi:hypothetical protein
LCRSFSAIVTAYELFCDDLEKMGDFYSRFLGLTITDEDLDRGICFLSANPQAEHHELALADSATAPNPPSGCNNYPGFSV